MSQLTKPTMSQQPAPLSFAVKALLAVEGVEVAAPLARFLGTSNPRHLRALKALMNGTVSREAMDRIAGASNSPHVIFELRALGLPGMACLVCERRGRKDRDGKAVRPGYYYLTAEGRQRVEAWLTAEGKTLDELLAAAAER